MLRKWHCQADITIHLSPVDPVLIKSGYATLDGPDMVPVQTLRGGRETYYFPGTSLKGVLRSHFERIARTLVEGSVCLPYYDLGRANTIPLPTDSQTERAAAVGCGFRSTSNGVMTTAAVYSESCAACRLFGSLRFGGRFSIGDAYPIPESGHITSKRNGVGIDRYTGGTVPGVLFDLLVLEGGTFETHLRVVNFEGWQLAAVNLLLIDLKDEILRIGSGTSRGLGRVKGEVKSYTLTYLKRTETFKGLAELVSDEERQQYDLFSPPLPEPIPLPAPQREGLRHTYSLPDWQTRLRWLTPTFEQFLSHHGGPKGVAGQGGRRG
jgi:CRISPR-associated RAMP protein (TIGR02581 family)